MSPFFPVRCGAVLIDAARVAAMEDAHAAVLELDEGKSDSNTFFAVYDGHGGASPSCVL